VDDDEDEDDDTWRKEGMGKGLYDDARRCKRKIRVRRTRVRAV
jgi:hypothetical protein